MNTLTAPPSDSDMELVAALAEGDSAAAAVVESWWPFIRNSLIMKGATFAEAEDIAAGVIADCFQNGRKLLHAYKRKGSFRALLRLVAVNRFIDKKRSMVERKTTALFECYDPPDTRALEKTDSLGVVDILRDAVTLAFEECDPREILILRLRFIHGVKQNALARHLGVSPAGVSRTLKKVLGRIRKRVMSEVKAVDPFLHLEWTDFVAMCADASSLFAREEEGPEFQMPINE